jgi:hypothetical protein
MILEEKYGLRILHADDGKKITDFDRTFFSDFVYLGKNDSQDKFDEVGREIWKYFIEEENPDIKEMQNQIKDLKEETQALKEENMVLGDILLDTDYRLLQIEIFGLETEF